MLTMIRTVAQTLRHAPGLRELNPLWDLLRKPYLWLLTAFGREQGIFISIAGASMRLHPIFATLNWEEIETASYLKFAQAIRANDVVYDIGAHIGTYSVIAARQVEPTGRVVAYEPNPAAREHLLRHLEWNLVQERILIRDLCCGAVAGKADFYWLPERFEGNSGLVPVEGFEQTQVQVTTLDEEVTRLKLIPTLIKIDVEGAEWDVLKGAQATLLRDKPQLLLSLHPPALAKLGTTPEMVLDWLDRQGYRCEEIGRDHEIHVFAEAR